MGRPRTPIGSYGKIRVYKSPDGYTAETLFRDPDGQLRTVRKVGRTKTHAGNNLKEALTERQHRHTRGLKPDSKFREAAKFWVAEVAHSRKGTTYDTYRRNLHHRVMPAFGELSLRECDDVSLVHGFLRSLEVEAKLSGNMVRGCRSVLSGVLGFAAQQGAITRNPVRDAGRVEGRAKPARALTLDERVDLLAKLDVDERAQEVDLPDLLRYFLGVGVRLGEGLGLRWCRVDLGQKLAVHGDNLVTVAKLCEHCRDTKPRHLDGRCEDSATRWTPAAGGGQVLYTPKTEAGYRILPLPDFVVSMLWLRYPGAGHGLSPVFPNTFGRWRDRGNTEREIRGFRDRAGYPWLTSHTFRKTSITIMDQQGLSARAIAGYHGHARPSITQDSYMDKTPEDRGAANAMDVAMRPRR